MSAVSCTVPNAKSSVLFRRVPRRSHKLETLPASRRSSSQAPPLISSFSPSLSAKFRVKLDVSSNPSPRAFRPVMQWQDVTVKMVVDTPASVAYELYSDRDLVPKWMPFCSSVEVSHDNPSLSRYRIKLEPFGQHIEHSFLAKTLQPIPNKKIQWISLEGFANRGSVRFFPRGPSSCLVEVK
ncbi:PREDICTED: uncharacterized protein LOC104801317 isoform X2 [Tarenaya hassleriana]|uniref:uncharacterized protein LOC104801317 isoform X2 n=1 Tax=Tarenaya hassleriana TaxID=28532 RepID=UPI00053C367D|nr:PREDICTED: uncharacterized protein LOC104801317 isoform X2 [Tarenaya hassleriana]